MITTVHYSDWPRRRDLMEHRLDGENSVSSVMESGQS